MKNKINFISLALFIAVLIFNFFYLVQFGYDSEMGFHRISSMGKMGSNYLLLMGIVHILVPSIKPLHNLSIIVLSIIFSENDFFSSFLYDLITGSFEVYLGNSQYPKLLIFLFISLALLVRTILHQKTFARFFNLLGMGVVIITTIVFHKVIVEQAYEFSKAEYKNKFLFYQELSKETLFKTCKESDYICFTSNHKKSSNPKIFPIHGHEKIFSHFIKELDNLNRHDSSLFEMSFDFKDDKEEFELENCLILKIKNQDEYMFIIDPKIVNSTTDRFFV